MEPVSEPTIEIEPMSIDQFAGSIVLILGAIGSLLLVIWQSRCACKCRLGLPGYWCFDCSREPPPLDDKDKKKNKQSSSKKEGDVAMANQEPRKIVADDRLVPEEIRRGTFPEPEVVVDEPDTEVPEEQIDIVPGSKGPTTLP